MFFYNIHLFMNYQLNSSLNYPVLWWISIGYPVFRFLLYNRKKQNKFLLPDFSDVWSFLAISCTPPYSLIFSTPSRPRNSMSSRSCLRVMPYRVPEAMSQCEVASVCDVTQSQFVKTKTATGASSVKTWKRKF